MNPTPTADSLFDQFPASKSRPFTTPISPDSIPEPYRSLLVHTVHMTVTVEEFYGGAVDVRVLETVHCGSEYSRKILLLLRESGRVVQFGLVQIDLDSLSKKVRGEILAGQTPLGRVLIQNDVLRDIHPAGYLKVELDAELTRQFGLRSPVTTYGRLGVISTDGQPAIEVLEILAPVDT